MNNLGKLFKSTGQELTKPVGFGKFRGKMIWDIDSGYGNWMEDTAGVARGTLARLQEEARLAMAGAEAQAKKMQEKADEFVGNLRDGLFDHQANFIKRFAASEYGGMFFEMGLGKTRTMLEMIKLRKSKGERVLVVCPVSVMAGWKKEIKEGYPSLSCIRVSGSVQQKLDRLDVNRDIYIINYEALRSQKDQKRSEKFKPVYKENKIKDKLKDMNIEWYVLDESHKIKNPSSSTYKSLMHISKESKYRWCLTGTPMTNSYADFYTQVTFMDRGLSFGSSFWSHFRKEYMVEGRYGSYSDDTTMIANLTAKVAKVCDIRKKSECHDLPDRVYQTREVDLTGKARQHYLSMARDSITTIESEDIVAVNKLTELMRLHQITGGGINAARFNQDKVDELSNVLDELPEGEKPVIVCRYSDEISSIQKMLDDRGMSHGTISGQVKQAKRDEDRAAFASDKLDAMILQEQAGGVGIDGLQNVSSTMIFFSYSYSWGDRQQAEARIHRTGQKKSCLYIDIVARVDGRETIDHIIAEAVKNKDFNINEFIFGVEELLKKQK